MAVLTMSAIVLAMVLTASPAGVSKIGVCQREGGKFVLQKPVLLSRGQRAPKKVRDVKPAYPPLPPNTAGTGLWIGEVLLGANGKVAHVWTLREPRFTPPFPKVKDAIVDAIRRWEFEPFVIGGEPTPLCMTVSVNIHWE